MTGEPVFAPKGNSMLPRSVRCNNPGNIRIGEAWLGLLPPDLMNLAQKAEHEFCVFKAPEYGFRAMAKLMHTYHTRYGVNTIREAIARWAPASENNTEAYIRSVCDYTGYGPDHQFPFVGRPIVMASLLKAMAIHEAGRWYFTQAQLDSGVRMAGEE